MTEDATTITIQDGIINREHWDKANLKILFVLKECYDTLRGTYSLVWFLNEYGAIGKTFKPLGRWARALGNCNSQDVDECMRACAVINVINKYGTNHRTSKKRLLEGFSLPGRSDQMLEQIAEINPDVVIFGNTYWLFSEKYNLPELGGDVRYAGKICGSGTSLDGKVVYNGYHPQYTQFRGDGEPNNPEEIAARINYWLQQK